MEFYSTYYKKLANYGQIKEIGEKFDELDANGDKALNATEMANIFAQQYFHPTMPPTPYSEDEIQEFTANFMKGIDQDNDGFVTYSEFIPTFIEFDVDQDAVISYDEFDLAQKRVQELEKQMDINAQYKILNKLSATDQEKQNAQKQIDLFKTERSIIYAEQDIKKKEILVGNIDFKINQIQEFIDNNTLLEFDEAQKLKEIEKLEIEKEVLVLEKDISIKKLALYTIDLELITAKENGNTYEIAMLEQQKISTESELNISERNLELNCKQAKIENNENLLTKFFIPEVMKENARQELDLLYDETQLLNQRKDLYEKTSTLSQTRADMNKEFFDFINSQSESVQTKLLSYNLQKLYNYIKNSDPQTQQNIDDLDEQQLIQQKEAQVSSLKVELIDKQIQLKAVLPKSDRKPFDEVKATLEAEIASLQAQIAELE